MGNENNDSYFVCNFVKFGVYIYVILFLNSIRLVYLLIYKYKFLYVVRIL